MRQNGKNGPIPSNIVFFDGVCGICNAFIDWLIRKDKKRKLRYSPLQGKAAQQLIRPEQLRNNDSIFFDCAEGIFQKSTAVLKILIELGGIYKLALLLFVFPRGLRDFVYDFVARNRYKIFGKREVCRLPTAEERSLFLD